MVWADPSAAAAAHRHRQGDERTATWLELFFDLAFVLVAELAVGLRDDRTLGGVLVFTGLFSSVWWAWAGFTFYANRFGTDDIVYRLAKLEAMLVSPDWPPAPPTRPSRWPGSRALLCRHRTRDQPVNLSSSRLGTHQHYSPAGANCCQSLLLDPDATISIDLRKRQFLLVTGRGE